MAFPWQRLGTTVPRWKHFGGRGGRGGGGQTPRGDWISIGEKTVFKCFFFSWKILLIDDLQIHGLLDFYDLQKN